MVCLCDHAGGKPLIEVRLKISEVAGAEYESRAYHCAAAAAWWIARRLGHRRGAWWQSVNEVAVDIGGPSCDGSLRGVLSVGIDEDLPVAEKLLGFPVEDEFLAVGTFDARDADPGTAELIRGVLQHPCIWKICGQIKQHLSQLAGDECLAQQLVNGMESQLASASEMVC